MSSDPNEMPMPLTLRVDEEALAAFLQAQKEQPTPRSPLAPLAEKTPPGTASVVSAGLSELLPPVNAPDLVLGLIHTPPPRPEVAWFYGRTGVDQLVAHRREDDANHVFVGPFGSETLAGVLAAAIDLAAPAVGPGVCIELQRSGFEAFSAVVDLLQEVALEAALNRVLPEPLAFDLADVVRCYARNLDTYDLRWLVQRAETLAPAPLQPFEESLARGLAELQEQQLLRLVDGWYRATEKMEQLATRIGPASGFCGVATLRREGDNWRREHLAAQRGIGSLWLMEFDEITLETFRVNIADVSGEILLERLRAAVSLPRISETPAQPGRCRSCGAPLRAGNRFCTACGVRVS